MPRPQVFPGVLNCLADTVLLVPRLLSTGLLSLAIGSCAVWPWCTTSAQEVDPKSKAGVEGSASKGDEGKPVMLFDGKNFDQWSVVEKFFFKNHGKVRVEQGVLILESGSPGTGIALKRQPPRNHYELSFQAKRIEGKDFFCGLTFPIDDSYCTFVIGGWGGQAVGLSNIDSFSAVENDTTDYLDVKDDQWYKIRLRVDGVSIKTWIDDKMFADVKIDDHDFDIWWEQEPLRPLGIASWDTTAGFKDIRLIPLKPKE